MCGICGFVTTGSVTLEQLNHMNDTMVHRGPDDAGAELFPFRGEMTLGLAHRRLSILDLSANGHQPFHSQEGDVVVVFNGEIYNFRKLKEELTGYPFFTECDTEVIVAAYRQWGEEFVRHIDGMFAIALFDRRKNRLILVRDRMGKKPLYYHWENGTFLFASTLKPIMAFPGFERRINREVLPRYLYNQYITGEDSILRGVHRLRPGQMLIFDGRSVRRELYWNLIEQYHLDSAELLGSREQAKEALRGALTEAVRRRMTADVPVGTFLSGGYDSSLVTAVAQSLSQRPVKTFSIGFEEKEYDEAPFAREVAAHLGTEHTNHYVTEEQMLELVASIPKYYDEPFADSSQIPSMLVAQVARRDVTVVLTGDGGDELFCGYGLYDKLAQAQKLEPFAKLLRPVVRGPLLARMPFAVRAILENSDPDQKTQFGRRGYADSIARILGCDGAELPYSEAHIGVGNWQIRRMLLDSTTYLPDSNLCKVDRATMKHSLEARNPLLDIGVVRTAFRTPHRFKYHGSSKKHILKELAYDYIPRELLDRPKKGFSVPTGKWLRGPLKEDLLRVTSPAYLTEQGIFDPEYTHAYVCRYLETGNAGRFSGSNPSKIVWPLYMFQKWYQEYME